MMLKYWLGFFVVLLQACAGLEQSVEEAMRAGRDMRPTQAESVAATKEALERGVLMGVAQLHEAGGFLNSSYHIAVPENLHSLTRLASQFGLHEYVDQFEQSLNRAAEDAIGAAGPVFETAIQAMTIQDVVTILTGPDDAATLYFRRSSEQKLEEAFLPIVKRATEANEVSRLYQQLTTRVRPMAMAAGIRFETVDLEQYVTQKAIDALFVEIALQEQKIRQDPRERATALLQKVFSYYQAAAHPAND